MNKQRLDELFKRYLADDLSPEEQTAFFYLLNDPANRDELHRLFSQLWEETSAHEERAVSSESQRRIQQVMDRIQPSRAKHRTSWVWMAAACLILVSAAVLFWKKPAEPQIIARAKTHEIATAYGQKKTIRMPDGSVIYLNAGSTLRYSDEYNETLREVELSGEAFFEVAKNPQKRFIVRNSQLHIEVLGTSFNVRAFDQAESAQVAVASGLVEVKELADSSDVAAVHATLSPGQELTLNRTSGSTTVSRVKDMRLLTAWKDGVLAMKGLPFTDVAAMLERWYDVDVVFNNTPLKNCRFTGEFNNLPINEVLDLLAKSAGFTYNITAKKIYVDGGNCY